MNYTMLIIRQIVPVAYMRINSGLNITLIIKLQPAEEYLEMSYDGRGNGVARGGILGVKTSPPLGRIYIKNSYNVYNIEISQ